MPAFFPVTAPGLILFRGYDGTYAFYTKDGVDSTGRAYQVGSIAWFAPSYERMQTIYAGDAEQSRGAEAEHPAVAAVLGERHAQHPVRQLAGRVAQPRRQERVRGGRPRRAAAAQQVYGDPFGGMPPGGGTGGPKDMQDYNTLTAVDIESGATQWWLGGIGLEAKPDARPEDESTTTADKLAENAYFLGAPLPVNGKLYVLLEKAGHLKASACLDPQKLVKAAPGPRKSPVVPELVWVSNWPCRPAGYDYEYVLLPTRVSSAASPSVSTPGSTSCWPRWTSTSTRATAG